MQRSVLAEFYQQLAALAFAVLVVHASYLLVIRPEAAALMASAGEGVARAPMVVLKDVEQEICLVLMLWAVLIIGLKFVQVLNARRALNVRWISLDPGQRVLPEDARAHLRPLLAQPLRSRGIIERALVRGLQRFAVTGDVPAVVAAVHETVDTEAERLDSELAMLRYIVWAIPSIGFIGTVRGIGSALGQAQAAIDGDIAGVTASLGVAFNSTFVALMASMLVMFLLSQLQRLQEGLILDAHAYCDETLVQHLAAHANP